VFGFPDQANSEDAGTLPRKHLRKACNSRAKHGAGTGESDAFSVLEKVI
jgi:hypothetical protein